MAKQGILSGQLEEFSLAELLQVMGMNANTGALHLEATDGRTGLVYFDAGALVSCIELDTEALTLGHVLQQFNLATGEQIEQAFRPTDAGPTWQTYRRTSDRSRHAHARDVAAGADDANALDGA